MQLFTILILINNKNPFFFLFNITENPSLPLYHYVYHKQAQDENIHRKLVTSGAARVAHPHSPFEVSIGRACPRQGPPHDLPMYSSIYSTVFYSGPFFVFLASFRARARHHLSSDRTDLHDGNLFVETTVVLQPRNLHRKMLRVFSCCRPVVMGFGVIESFQ